MAYVSMKFTPMYSFFSRTSPSFNVGMGTSVLYSKTSVPPVLLMRTASIVAMAEPVPTKADSKIRIKRK